MKDTEEEKLGTILGNDIAASVALSLTLPQTIILGCENYKVKKKTILNNATHTDPKARIQSLLSLNFVHTFSISVLVRGLVLTNVTCQTCQFDETTCLVLR